MLPGLGGSLGFPPERDVCGSGCLAEVQHRRSIRGIVVRDNDKCVTARRTVNSHAKNGKPGATGP